MTDILTSVQNQIVNRLGKISLGFYPTPLHRLDRLSEATGVNFYVKREDFSGTSLFGGNKIRKLEFLLKEAKDQGCDTVFTYGATQSNHVMQTATAARRCGMKPVVFLGAIVEPQPGDVRANLLLDTILGAEIHILPSNGRSTRDTMAANKPLFEARKAELEAQGHRVYDIPVGGSTARGAAGFASAFIEIMMQCRDLDVRPDYLFCGTGSGGTLAGLAAGKAMIDSPVKLQAVQVGKKDPATYGAGIVQLANEILSLVGASQKLEEANFEITPDYVGPGYEKPYKEANDDIRLLARTEGIFTDPVYSGKGFHGMLDMIRRGKIAKGSTVIFLHTGGTTALFSEAEIIGDLSQLTL